MKIIRPIAGAILLLSIGQAIGYLMKHNFAAFNGYVTAAGWISVMLSYFNYIIRYHQK